ncbi:NAD(P)H-dependent oxidoreductase [Aquisalimonas sp. 2447]|uniref:NADPH-dependent FMN reductase n=1 Tax=Aquisalimonas sp. 2447 TaxID=2740807 RepID=UPI0014325538|nr:NAD(P)H-dependent oxidoreductase [Aquisalimonas sp. 2447]QIT56107.1 NAD(P)H-dependent oxidoreductase [Aquisalimonas sp. 2447]
MDQSHNSILVFAGSARADSFNKRLARLAADRAREAGGMATFADLRDYPMPLYDGDLEREQGVPEHARRLKALLADHTGLVVVSPEYNGFITPLLKNTLDWLSRPDDDREGLALFRNRVACVLSASPGGFGGMRSLALARQLLTNLGVTVLPDQLAVPRAAQAFTDAGDLADQGTRERLDQICHRLVETLNRLNPRAGR